MASSSSITAGIADVTRTSGDSCGPWVSLLTRQSMLPDVVKSAPPADQIAWSLAEGIDATYIVLDAVRLGGCESRTEVEGRTGLGRAVVTQRIAELVARGILDEGGARPSTGGRPARRLRFHAEAGRLLAVDLGATSIDVAITNLDGAILSHACDAADISDGPDVVLQRVEEFLDHLLENATHAGVPIFGVGLGVPGPVEFSTGRPVSPPIMPGWDEYPIRQRLEARYQAPVWVDNDVNSMAMGEWRKGVAVGHRNSVFVKIGTGIGAGLISDGVLHRGSQGAAGDVGHIQVGDATSITCRCGNVGCLEALAGGEAIGRDAELVARAGRSARLAEVLARDGFITAKAVALAARHGDAASAELIGRSGRLVGGMLAGIVNFFNPSLIVVGGGVSEAGDVLLAAIRESVYRRSLPLATRELSIVRSTLGGYAGVIGAAAIAADELFGRQRLAVTLARTLAEGPSRPVGPSGVSVSRHKGAAAPEDAGRLAVAHIGGTEESGR